MHQEQAVLPDELDRAQGQAACGPSTGVRSSHLRYSSLVERVESDCAVRCRRTRGQETEYDRARTDLRSTIRRPMLPFDVEDRSLEERRTARIPRKHVTPSEARSGAGGRSSAEVLEIGVELAGRVGEDQPLEDFAQRAPAARHAAGGRRGCQTRESRRREAR